MKFSTYTGRIIDLECFNASMVCIHDVAHHLTKICRFGGSLELNVHYSVAQHSLAIMSYMLQNGADVELAKYALFHDASEAYLGDVISPVKELVPQYKALEKRVLKVIFEKYIGYYDPFMLKRVKDVDKRIVIDEAKTFHTFSVPLFTERNGCSNIPLNIFLEHLPMENVKRMYIHWCSKLGVGDNISPNEAVL